MNDPIVDEVRRVREEHAARFGYDLDAIYQDIKEQEKNSGRTFVTFEPNRIELKPVPQSSQSTVVMPSVIRPVQPTVDG